MPNCVQCKTSLPSINSLGLHFKIAHKKQIFSIYQCGEQHCSRTFDEWSALKKHLNKKHNILSNKKQSTKSNKQNTISNNLEIQEQNLSSDSHCENYNISKNNISFEDAKLYVENQAEMFIAKLYNNYSIPRCHAQTIISDTQLIFEECLPLLWNKIRDTCISLNTDTAFINDIDSMFDTIKGCFKNFSTEYKIFKHFETCGEYIPPKEYLIGHRLEGVNTRCGIQAKHVPVYGQFVELRKVLERFLELPYAFESTISYIKVLKEESECVTNFIQSPLWKRKIVSYNKDDIVLPLFIYYDDFEPNNPLGPHCDKLGAVYCTIPCLSPECQSIIDNIFLILLFHSEDRKWFGNKRIFSPLIEELQFLENKGITINTSEGNKIVFFVLALLLGDNLGLHGMTGFIESFNSKYPCRFCKCTKRETEINYEENVALLRSEENYERDIMIDNSALTGLKEVCVFNEINSYHITSNYMVDIMHDVLEGVCHYDILLILNHFDKNIESFSLDILNFRLAMFDFGPVDISNRPPQISKDNLKKNKLKMTASEMLCFTRFFGVLIGDLISENDKFWQLYILLIQILDILLSKTLAQNISLLLNNLVYEHNKLYIELGGNNLKPKFHHLLHYAKVFEMSGPFVHYSSMRFEAKHRSLKKSCYTNSCRKNITKSVAIKHQLQFCFRLKACESILPKVKIGPGESMDITLIDNFELFKDMLPTLENKIYFISNWIEYKGTRYQIGMVVIIDYNVATGPIFGEITKIFVQDNYPLFLCFIYETIGYNSHVHAYEVSKSYNEIKITTQENLSNPFPIYSHRMSNGELYCVLRCLQ